MDTYGHLLEDSDKRAAQSLDKAIKEIQKMNELIPVVRQWQGFFYTLISA